MLLHFAKSSLNNSHRTVRSMILIQMGAQDKLPAGYHFSEFNTQICCSTERTKIQPVFKDPVGQLCCRIFAYSLEWMSLQAYQKTIVQLKVKCSSLPQHTKPWSLHSILSNLNNIFNIALLKISSRYSKYCFEVRHSLQFLKNVCKNDPFSIYSHSNIFVV